MMESESHDARESLAELESEARRKMRDPSCATCRFWSYLEEEGEGGWLIGWCRRYPPTRFAEGDDSCTYPVTQDPDWCGEYKPKASDGNEKRYSVGKKRR